ncbi:MAG: Ig-like domain-containing protein [Lachnospiraceae bacterium]|nr:Ig-like domain-containing protein [Lachnospiraceae bacterium]
MSIVLSVAMLACTGGVNTYALTLNEEDTSYLIDEAITDELSDEAGTAFVDGSEILDEQGGGYRELPDERDVPFIEDSVEYSDICNALVDGDDYISLDRASGETRNGASAEDSAYPFAYAESDSIETYIKEHFPANRSQGGEGACWAFSVIGTSELYMITHGITDMTDPDKEPKDIDYSELHLAYWTYADEGTPSIAGDTGDKVTFTGKRIIDVGGNARFGVETLMQRRGVVQESVADYSKANSVKLPHSEIMEGTEREDCLYLKNGYSINKENIDLAKQVIVANGALGVSFWKNNTYINMTNAAVCSPEHDTNHAVVIVGWDDDYPKENFNEANRPENNGAWLCRNSYTTETKINYFDSYFWLSYEDGSIPCYWVYEMMDKNDPKIDNFYFYDSQMHWVLKTPAQKSANIYRANSEYENETLRAISMDLGTNFKDVGYTVDIYTGIEDPEDGPESGTKHEEATTEGMIALGGTYTITLKEPVVLNKGEYFSIVVTLDNGYSVNIEDNFNSWASQGVTATVAAGKNQSFIMKNGIWRDTGKSDNKNLIIHALTSNGTKEGRIDIDKRTFEFGDDRAVGDTEKLTATVYDADGNADPVEVTWTSSDEDVVTVGDDGTLTVKGNGTAKVTAAAGTRVTSCDVTVNLHVWKVKVDCNGGSIKYEKEDGGVIYYTKTEYKVINGCIFTPPTPSLPKSSFAGWEYEGNVYTEGIKVTCDLELKATWTRQKISNLTAEVNTDHGNPAIVYSGDRIILNCDVEEAAIYYSFKNIDVTAEGWQLYSSPILISQKEGGFIKIYAFARGDGYDDSEKNVFTFVLNKEASVESLWGDITDTDDRKQCGSDDDGYPVIPGGIWISDASYEQTVSYTGSPVTFDGIRVFNENMILVEGKDYSVSYSNNTNVSAGKKTAGFTVTGLGDYSGSIKKEFSVVPAGLDNDPIYGKGVTPGSVTLPYTGKAVKPSIGFYWGDKQLGSSDYKMELYRKESYKSADDPGPLLGTINEAGDYIILLKGKGNFTGNKEIQLAVVTKTSIKKVRLTGFSKSVMIPADPAMNAVQPEGLKITLNGSELKKDVDYSIEYRSNDKPGNAVMIVKGEGDYAGTLTVKFKVTAIPVKNVLIKEGTFKEAMFPDEEILLSHRAEQKDVELVYDGRTLVKDVDYTLSYKNIGKAGKATMKVTGTGRYKGTFTRKYNITPIDLSRSGDRIWVCNKEIVPDNWKQLSEGIDLGTGAHRPGGAAPSMLLLYEDSNGDATELLAGMDYTVKYSNNKVRPAPQKYKPATVAFKGKGFFTGKVTGVFELKTNVLSPSTVTISAPDKVRSDKANGLFSIPVLKDAETGKQLKAGVEYSNEYSYVYASDALLVSGAVRHPGETVEAEDILKEGTDAVIQVTAEGRENEGKGGYPLADSYTGSISTTYRVKAGVIDSAKAVINGGKAYAYTGRPVEPGKDEITVTIDGKTLTASDYDIVGYNNNTNAGTAGIIIRGRGKYGGSKTFTFKIARTKMK